jgi:putative DNA-invertase from lambdoid prophage Rac
MSRTFAYLRVSTTGQNTENQLLEIQSAGFAVDANRVISETVSGSVPAFKRPEFAKLVDRLEKSDVILTTKLDRLGRNTVDILNTVEKLTNIGVRVHCLALGGMDLTSAAGKMTLSVISAVSCMELDLLKERTAAGLVRARAAGKKFGRPATLTPLAKASIIAEKSAGASYADLAKQYGVTRSAIQHVMRQTKAA